MITPSTDQPFNCEDARFALQERWDGVEGLEDTRLGDHLTRCTGCREWWAMARAIQVELDRQEAPLPPPGLSLAIRRRLAADAISRERNHRRLKAGLLVAASMGFALLLVFGRSSPGEPALLSYRPSVERPPVLAADGPEFRSLEEGLAGVTTGVAARVRLLAGQSIPRPQGLLAAASPESGDGTSELGSPDLAAAGEPLDDLRTGATVALRPVANSTRKAFGLVFGSYYPDEENQP